MLRLFLALVVSHPLTLFVLYLKSEIDGFRSNSVFSISSLSILLETSKYFKWVELIILKPVRIMIVRPNLKNSLLCVENTKYYVRSY